MSNALKERIARGEIVTAAWIDTGSPEVCEIVVNAGWDVVVIDCEHGAAPLEDGLSLIRAVQAAGGEAVLRVPDGSDTTLKRALDRGARSILVPMVNSVEQAKSIVHSCFYPPRGGRGYAAPIVRASHYGRWTDYAKEAHDDLLLMVQCEHIDAVAHVAEIGAIDGIDMVFVGPNDLSGSIGLLEQLDHPDLLKCKEEVERAGRESGVKLGTILGGGRNYSQIRDAGYSFIVGPADVGLLYDAARAARIEMADDLDLVADAGGAARDY
ncbi:aldolase/citrate lyase family protein [Martelella sp. AD-3]|uniref:HpcH/HpaI aldolase family protein n=1 Tax=Martelella sp. AD-3 TaxID=686597 RepID=UPI0004644CAE|nr:aldolase/citrate lyase family protein [Martelella sp. AD-3]AMM86025.1 aldolase [Martelella sp. AD-3]MAM11474.1 aldolase [Rhizobiaceae bacterium]|tara:strand:- start:238 stop:1041 length:804 start_codon:yes stop_codon:yes gene_type:complete